jgi:tRNA G18 (ribose-2'-O)-methylase SpoU
MPERTIHSKQLFGEIDIPPDYIAPIIVGYDIKTPENMGNIIRLADNFGSKLLLFVTNLEHTRNSRIKKTASSSFSSVNWSFCKEEELKSILPQDYRWIAIETSSDSENIYDINFPKKIVLFVGNEINGINSMLLDKCYKIVHIPLHGNNTSMNVSHALAIALSECQKKHLYGNPA